MPKLIKNTEKKLDLVRSGCRSVREKAATMKASVCIAAFPSLSRILGSARQEERQCWGFIYCLDKAENFAKCTWA